MRGVAKALIGGRNDWRLRKPSRPSAPRPGRHLIGPAVAIATLAVGWFAFAGAVGEEDEGGNVGLALFVGAVSIQMMAWSNILAVRIKALEQWFGGLDRMYRWHRWFGALSVGAMWWHIQSVDEVEGIRGASKDVADAAEGLADTGSTMLYVLVAISFLRWIPTRWWRLSHKLLVVPYAFACWHFYTATKPYANASPWGIWFAGFMLLGLGTWVVRVLWRDMVRRGRDHEVTRVESANGVVTLELAPLGSPLSHDHGQFVFLRLATRGLSEPHPFTIASAPGEKVLRFVIKDLGDWSGRLAGAVRVGDKVVVEGPYGRLHPIPTGPARDRIKHVVWVAGGVGITPFLGAACSREPGEGPLPHLFFSVRSRDDAPGLAELERAAAEGRIALHVHASAEGNRLRGDHITDALGTDDLSRAWVVMCGPDSLVAAMRTSLRGLGAREVHVEGFDIRTGVGPDLSREIDELLGERIPGLR